MLAALQGSHSLYDDFMIQVAFVTFAWSFQVVCAGEMAAQGSHTGPDLPEPTMTHITSTCSPQAKTNHVTLIDGQGLKVMLGAEGIALFIEQ